MENQVIRISSIEDRWKRAKLNNVIESLNTFVKDSSNDETVQDYGMLSYCGPVSKGQIIQGDKCAKKSGTPVIVSNTYLGKIDNNGALKIENTTYATTSYATQEGYTISGGTVICNFYSGSASSSYTRTSYSLTCCSVCTQTCEDEDGNTYTLEVTNCCWNACMCQVCVWKSGALYPGMLLYECPLCFWCYCCDFSPYLDCAGMCDITCATIGYVIGDDGNWYYCYELCATYAALKNASCVITACAGISCKYLIACGISGDKESIDWVNKPPISIATSNAGKTAQFDVSTSSMFNSDWCNALCMSAHMCFYCCMDICKTMKQLECVCMNVRYY